MDAGGRSAVSLHPRQILTVAEGVDEEVGEDPVALPRGALRARVIGEAESGPGAPAGVALRSRSASRDAEDEAPSKLLERRPPPGSRAADQILARPHDVAGAVDARRSESVRKEIIDGVGEAVVRQRIVLEVEVDGQDRVVGAHRAIGPRPHDVQDRPELWAFVADSVLQSMSSLALPPS